MIEVFKAHDVGYFLYIGGNDSMDTANKVAELAHERGLDLVGVGVPKTIDNDVGDSEFKLIDHTPGYGSVAKYWMHMVQNANEENAGSSPADPVLVMQAMGRKIGFIPAAARLADPGREMPLQIYLAESPCSLEQLADQVNDRAAPLGPLPGRGERRFRCRRHGRGARFVRPRDVQLQPDDRLPGGRQLSRIASGWPPRAPPAATSPGTDQRHAMASPRRSIWKRPIAAARWRRCWPPAARAASWRRSSAIRARSTACATTRCRWPKSPTASEAFPAAWIAPNGYDVTDDFVRYAQPLVGEDMVSLPLVDGRQRLARLSPIFADQKLPKYVPQADREK